MEDLLNSLREREKMQPKPSYAEQLEEQKKMLLKQREIDDLKKLTNDMKTWCQQLETEDRCLLEQANRTKALCEQMDKLKIEVQNVIDQNIAFTLDNLRETCHRRNALKEQRSRKQQVISKMKQQLKEYEELLAQTLESKGQTLLKKAQEQVEEEKSKLQGIRSEIDNIRKAKYDQQKQNWDKKKLMFVEMAKLWTQIKTQEEQTDTVKQNNGLLRTRILQLDDEIQLQRQKQEAENKRRNTELNERIMTPMKIIHAGESGNAFKNPNDFPMLIEKVQIRRSYEHIFKRPEYMELHNSRKAGRKNSLSNSSEKKSMDHRSQPTEKITQYFKMAQPPKVASQLPKYFKNPVANRSIQNKRTIAKSSISNIKTMPIKPQKQEQTVSKKIQSDITAEKYKSTSKTITSSVKRKIFHSENSTKEPTPLVATVAEPVKKQTDSSQLQPMSTCIEETKQVEHAISEDITNVSDEIPFSENKNEHKNLETRLMQAAENSSTVPLPNISDAVRNEENQKSAYVPDAHRMEVVSAQQKDGKQQNSESNVDQPASEIIDCESNNKRAVSSDAISLSSTISSLDLEDRDHSSDLGFELSPIGSRKENKTGGSDGDGSGDLDFDFLSDSPKQTANPQKKKTNDFDFFSSNNDSSFDFF